MKKILLGLLLLAGLFNPVKAQQYDRLCFDITSTASGAAITSCQPVTGSNPLPVTLSLGTFISANAVGTTGSVVATMAATAAKTNYLCGFNVSAVGGTAAVGPIVVSGLLGGSQTYNMNSSVSGNTQTFPFSPCIPASAANVAIVITTTADASATAVAVNSWGYQY